ncbi:hypothetical protein QQF64_023532, partial [Cirrhinus molitorella]
MMLLPVSKVEEISVV